MITATLGPSWEPLTQDTCIKNIASYVVNKWINKHTTSNLYPCWGCKPETIIQVSVVAVTKQPIQPKQPNNTIVK